MDKKMESIKKEIRSVLISYPKGVSLDDFRRTYKDLLGVRLPTREFGFTVDVDFLYSIPDVVHIQVDNNGTYQLFALADESTQHIKKLVGKQRVQKKTNKKSQSSSFFKKPSEVTRSRVSTTRCRPFVPAALRAEIIQIVKLYPDGIGYASFILAYQSMFQRAPNLSFLSSSPVEILQKLENAIPEVEVKVSGGQQKLFFVDQNEMFTNKHASGVKSSFQHFKAIDQATSSSSTEKSHEHNGFLDVSAVSEFVKYNTKKILMEYPEGILAVHFPILYESFTQKAFDLHELGYNCLLDFVDALPDISIRVQSPTSANDWILYHIDFAPNINDAARSSVRSSNVHPLNNSRVSNSKGKTAFKTAPPALQYIQSKLPTDDDQYFPVFISAFVNPSLFWVQLQTDDAINNLNRLEKEMEYFYNSQLRSEYRLKDSDVLIGSSCVAHFTNDHHWYRCVISSLLNAENVKVFLIDYGSWETIPRSHLFYLKYSFICLPAQAFQAQLALVQPPTKVGSWEINAQKRFLDLCNKAFIMAKVDSMQYQVASVFLCDTSGEEEIHINQTLVNEGLAEYSIQNEYDSSNSQLATSKVPSETNGAIPSNHQTNSEKISNIDHSLKSPYSSHILSNNGYQALNHSPKDQLVNKIKALQFSNGRKSVRRILLGDGYHIHLLIVDKEAFVSGEDLYNLLWKGKGADILACRLEFKGVTIPTMAILKEKFPDLFSECERYAVGGFDKTENSYSVILYPLKYSLTVLNVFGHPSSKVREILCQEIKEFNPLSSVWSKSEENGEHYEVLTDEEKNLDRICSFDLKAMREGLVCKRLKLQSIHKGELNESFLNQMKQIEIRQSYISRRIKEIEAVCLKYSEEIS